MVEFSHTQSPVHLHSFAYECPANCFEVTIKRTIEERKGTPGSNWHLGLCIKKSFYIFELKIDKGTETGRHKIHYSKESSTSHPRTLLCSRICFTLIQPRDVQYTGWSRKFFLLVCILEKSCFLTFPICLNQREFEFRRKGLFCQFGINFKVD